MKNENIDEKILEAKKKLKKLLSYIKSGVEGCGTDGKNLRVYVSDHFVIPLIPTNIGGFSVVLVVSDKIKAQK